MEQTVKITCPSCGATAPHSQFDRDFVCEYCGTRYQVKSTGSELILIPFLKSLNDLKTGIDRTGSEMTIQRLKEEIAELSGKIRPVALEYEQLKYEVENPGIALKYRKYWWIGIPVSIFFFILGIFTDKISTAFLGVAIFVSSILMYMLAAQKAIRVKLITRRYEELSRYVIPLKESIDRKRQLIQKYQELLDQ